MPEKRPTSSKQRALELERRASRSAGIAWADKSIKKLGSMGSPEAGRALGRLLSHRDWHVQLHAARWLEVRHAAPAAPQLIEAMHTAHPLVASAAARALRQQNPSYAASHAIEAFGSEMDREDSDTEFTEKIGDILAHYRRKLIAKGRRRPKTSSPGVFVLVHLDPLTHARGMVELHRELTRDRRNDPANRRAGLEDEAYWTRLARSLAGREDEFGARRAKKLESAGDLRRRRMLETARMLHTPYGSNAKTMARLDELMPLLPPDNQKLMRRHLAGETSRQIATETGVPREQVERGIAQAMVALAKADGMTPREDRRRLERMV